MTLDSLCIPLQSFIPTHHHLLAYLLHSLLDHLNRVLYVYHCVSQLLSSEEDFSNAPMC